MGNMDDSFFLKHIKERHWHSGCRCPRCLFNYYKSKNKKMRMTWNSFLFYFLYKKYKSTGDSLRGVVNTYVNLTSDRIKSIGYTNQCDLYKIISRVGKKINLGDLEFDFFYSSADDPYIEMKSIMELNKIPQDKYLLPERRHTLVEFSGAVATYLERESMAGRKIIKHRDILRRFKRMRAVDLLLVLDFLEVAKIIAWNRGLKKISLRPAKAWLGFHLKTIKDIRDEKMASLGQPIE